MLFKQIIEFEFGGPVPPYRTCAVTPKTEYFHDKTKISKANLQVNYYLQYAKKYC